MEVSPIVPESVKNSLPKIRAVDTGCFADGETTWTMEGFIVKLCD